MDEIAAEMGMSKKTLYQHFAAKKDLLREGLQDKVDAIARGLDQVLENGSADYPSKLSEVMRFMSEALPRPSRRFLRDVAKSAPDVWRPVYEKRAEVIRTRFGKLLRQGVGEGLVRDDLEVEFLILAFTALVQKVISPETLAELPVSVAQAFEKLYSILLLGVLTEKARKDFLSRSGREADR